MVLQLINGLLYKIIKVELFCDILCNEKTIHMPFTVKFNNKRSLD